MIAVTLTLAAFAAWCLVGLGVLVAVRADTSSLRVALTAPALGSALVLLPLFLLSDAGVAMESGALPVVIVLLVVSAIAVVLRRPRLPATALPVLGLCVVDLILIGRPMFSFGLNWVANANDDMANYVLSATKLLHHGLLMPVDVAALAHDRDYATALQTGQSAGSRPGADITLGAFAAVTGRLPYQLFMPFILASNLTAICAAGALALQTTRRWWAATVAAALLVASPLAAFGVLQQLLPQVWGLALAAALFALAMRAELYERSRPSTADLVPIAVLATALIIVYVELAAAMAAAYALYIAVLVARRRVALRSLAWPVGAVVAASLVVINLYLPRELEFLHGQVVHGTSTNDASLFGFALVPAALPGVLGIELLPPDTLRYLGVAIVLAIVLLAGAAGATLASARRGVAASIVLCVDLALGIFLGTHSAAFGIFKLYMYVQPFLVAAAAVWLSALSKRWLLATAAVGLAILVGVQLRTTNVYVDRSENPVDLRHASASDLLPKFRRSFADADEPVVAATATPTLAKLEAAGIGNRPLYFVSRSFFQDLVTPQVGYVTPEMQAQAKHLARTDGWKKRSFDLLRPGSTASDTFKENTHASKVIDAGRCLIALPSGSQTIVNRTPLPEGSPNLDVQQCRSARNLLVFTSSALGQSYYLPQDYGAVSFFQLESDYFFPGRMFSGFGRYALFRVLGPSRSVRLELDVTDTLIHDGSNRLPPAAAVGSRRVRLPLVGRGSARVFSPPFHPQMIDGQPYVLIDMNRVATLHDQPRHGVENLYGSSIVTDPRRLTSYVRNISLVSNEEYDHLRRPSAVKTFPADLGNPALEYSGLYEDGWVSEDSYVVLAGGPAAELTVRANALPLKGQRLQIRVNGRRVASRAVAPGDLDIHVSLPASRGPRHIELRWARTMRLKAPDLRPAAALLKYLGIQPHHGS